MKGDMKLTIELPRIPTIELVAIEGLNRLAAHMGISDQKIGEARILVSEAIINAFEHSGDQNQNVVVEFTITEEKLVIFVQDYGEGFDPEKIDDPDIFEKIGAKNKRGWGLKLMKSMSDDFHIESGLSGTKINITKNLK